MKMKKIELNNKTNRKSFYEFVCGDLVIGYLKKNSINQWTIFPELPNFKTMTICSDIDEGIYLMEEKLTEFINMTIINNNDLGDISSIFDLLTNEERLIIMDKYDPNVGIRKDNMY